MSKPFLAIVAIVISSLQAWDSHALDAEQSIQWLILAGVLIPGVACFVTSDARVRGGAVLAAAALLVTARMVSEQPMPGLALAALFPGIIVLLDHVRTLNARGNENLAGRPPAR